MSTAPQIARAVTAPGAAAPPAMLGQADGPALAVRLRNEWLPRAAWTIRRTGRPGLVGIALLLAAALFLFSTHLQVAAEVEALRAELVTAQRQARTATVDKAVEPAPAMRALPARTDMPAILHQLFQQVAKWNGSPDAITAPNAVDVRLVVNMDRAYFAA